MVDDLDASRELNLEVVYRDVHLVELEACLNTGSWRGRVRAYTIAQDLSTFAVELKRFTDGAAPWVEFVAGGETGIGLIGLRFYRIDRSGHTACHVRLQSGNLPDGHRTEQISRLELEVKTEIWAVVNFAAQLSKLANSEDGQASMVIET